MTEAQNDKPVDTNEQIQQRREKLEQLREAGQAYPNGYQRDHVSSDIVSEFEALDKEAIADRNHEVTIAGRIMTRRLMGRQALQRSRMLVVESRFMSKANYLKKAIMSHSSGGTSVTLSG